MLRLILLSLCGAVFALTPAVSATAASSATAQKATNATSSNHAKGDVWLAETLTGTIMTVQPNQDLIVVQSTDKVPFDVRVTRSTRIRSGDKTLRLQDLSSVQGKPVTVTIVPTGSGDIARTIRIAS